MNSQELISSGIIELYCLGIASDEERLLVEELANGDASIIREIASVNEALAHYAISSPPKNPPVGLKEKILASITSDGKKDANLTLPPRLIHSSTIEEWLNYLDENEILEPAEYEGVYFMELPGNEDYYTYVVFAKEGGVVPEETHHTHDEYLLICKGTCEMTIGGEKNTYSAGDFIEITPGIPHSAFITGKERMIVIGQRRAA